MSRMFAVLLLVVAGACDRAQSVCDSRPPPDTEFRALCKKGGQPEDCEEALNLCRDHRESARDYCKRICHDDPAGKPSQSGCGYSAPECSFAVTFERLECGYCAGV